MERYCLMQYDILKLLEESFLELDELNEEVRLFVGELKKICAKSKPKISFSKVSKTKVVK